MAGGGVGAEVVVAAFVAASVLCRRRRARRRWADADMVVVRLWDVERSARCGGGGRFMRSCARWGGELGVGRGGEADELTRRAYRYRSPRRAVARKRRKSFLQLIAGCRRDERFDV